MKVLMTADAVGGVWTYALDLADALAAHDVEVELATMGPAPDRAQRAALHASAVAAVHESRFALEWEDDPWEDVERAGAWLLDLAERVEPDVVHLNGYVHADLPWQAPVVVVAHSDVLSWWRWTRGCAAPARFGPYRRDVEQGLRQADLVCAPTGAVLDDLAASYDFATPTRVIANGRAAGRRAAGPREQLVVGIGRFWDEAKNVAALERVTDRSPLPVLLAGPGTPLGRLTPDEVARLLARASIFASPARYEPFGLAALEAAQAGCALVLGDIPSLREVWGDAALFVPPDDDEALLAALRTASRPRELHVLASRARARAARYAPEATAAGMAQAYAHVLAGARTGAPA
jgi:glycogen synthase